MLVNGLTTFNMQVFKLHQDTFTECSHTFIAPEISLRHATGGVLIQPVEGDLDVVVCGGEHAATNDENTACTSLTDATSTARNLDIARTAAASLLVDNGQTLWLTGGNFGVDKHKHTELVRWESDPSMPMTEAVDAPQLPRNLKYHCIVRLGPQVAIMIGGQESVDKYNPYSWSVNLDRLHWRSKILRTLRSMHTCGAIRDVELPEVKFVFAVGGQTPDGYMTQTVDVLFVRTGDGIHYFDSSWTFGPKLPYALSHAVAVTMPDQSRFFLIGGTKQNDDNINYNHDVFQTQCLNKQCIWSAINEDLGRNPSVFGLAFMLPPVSMGSMGRLKDPCDYADFRRGIHS